VIHQHFLTTASALLLALASTYAQDRVRTGAWQTTPAAPPNKATTAAPADANRTFSGKVIETMDAAGYTYVRVEAGTEKLWAAAPKTVVKVGDAMTITDGMPMPNYHSKSLDRDFPMIYFAGSLGSGDATAQLPAGHPPIGGGDPKLPANHPPMTGGAATLPADHPPLGSGAAKPKVELTGITKAKGGQTIQEVFAGKQKLAGKEVTVRGKVVKYNAQIMGKNWLHIQDGTGTAGSNDLTITTSTPAKVGDTVLVTGLLSADKDFGAGYKFSVILDDAKVVLE